MSTDYSSSGSGGGGGGGDAAARVVVGLDFGTTYSGFAFAHMSDPDHIYTFYDWPMQTKGGGRPYCKTITGLYYKTNSSSRNDNLPASTTRGLQQQQEQLLRLEGWGWPARVRFSDDIHAFQQSKRRMARSESPDSAAFNAAAAVKVGTFLTRFKLYLATTCAQDTVGPASPAASDLPSSLNLNGVVTDFLREIGEFIMEHLRGKYGKHLSKDVVQWCVTVPSIWDDKAKQQMKACMHRAGLVLGDGNSHSLPLIIVLEPEAASIYCQQRCKHLNLRAGDKFLVADIGGGTTDIVVQAKVDDSASSMKVREVSRSSGGLCGGTHVDRNFISFLSSKIGCLEKFLVQNPGTIQKLLSWWEGTKASFDGNESCSAELSLPAKLALAWEDHERQQKQQLHSAADESKSCSSSSSSSSSCSFSSSDPHVYDELELSCADMKAIFDPVVDNILDLIAAQIAQTSDIRLIMVVGGFSASPYLMKRIRAAFAHLVEEVINPPDPGSAVCQGAVALATNKESILSRIVRKTYAIHFSPLFESELDPPEYESWVDGIARCLNRIDIFVQEGNEVEVDHCKKKIYSPLQIMQTSMKLQLYSSLHKNPRYTTGDGTMLEGTVLVDMSQDLELGLDREVEVSMFFGRSSIEVKARGLNFGDHKEHCMLPVNLVSNWV
jgi:hypothetical protein